LPNILQYPVVLIGCIRAGLVVVNINPLYTEYEIEKHLENAKVKGIITLNIFAKKIEKLTKKFSIENVFITEMGDLLGFFKGNFVNFFLKKVKKNSFQNLLYQIL
jgi:long-chain acyl-CoA synthetase